MKEPGDDDVPPPRSYREFVRLHDQLRALAMKKLRPRFGRDAAEDPVQRICVRFAADWESGEFNATEPLEPYAAKAARNELKNHYRSARRLSNALKTFQELQGDPQYGALDPLEQLVHAERAERFGRVLSTGPKRALEIYRMVRDEEKTYKEIAAAFGISERTVESHVNHVHNLLRTADPEKKKEAR